MFKKPKSVKKCKLNLNRKKINKKRFTIYYRYKYLEIWYYLQIDLDININNINNINEHKYILEKVKEELGDIYLSKICELNLSFEKNNSEIYEMLEFCNFMINYIKNYKRPEKKSIYESEYKIFYRNIN